jgi:hypothetical protein
MPVLTDRDHPQQIVHIKHSERALKEIACLTKTEVWSNSTKAMAAKFLSTFRNELLCIFTLV